MRVLIIVLLTLFSSGIYAQTSNTTISKYGSDSATCISNLSTMMEYAKIKVYDYALPPWRYVFTNCPNASKNTFIYGASIFKYLIEQQENTQIKNKYIDTLMQIYDKRIQYYGDEAFVNIRKGMDLFNYRPSDKQTVYQYLENGIKQSGAKTEINALIVYIQVSISLANEGKLPKETAIKNYNEISSLLDQMEGSNPNTKAVSQAREIIDKLVAGTGLTDCNQTNEIYLAKLSNNSLTIEQIKPIIKTLEISKCIESEAYLKAYETLYPLEPTAANATTLARIYLKKQDYKKAEDYYLLAIGSETDPDILANLYYEVAIVEYSGLSENVKARDNALKAINLKKNWGQPYILIGNIYASSSNSCTGNEVEKLSVFWAAVDKFIAAKNADAGVTDEANSLIARYSVYFPTSENLFFYGLKAGESYTVKCWINENTKVRAR